MRESTDYTDFSDYALPCRPGAIKQAGCRAGLWHLKLKACLLPRC
ncbi:MAG: hypothetical protein GQF41_0443 [Candidatus Rifleibacterium amylolyticum]|nr:MAG: hypothetical protein GQF41_0443 [Candidatus Rifleibacterium amylolyticum]